MHAYKTKIYKQLMPKNCMLKKWLIKRAMKKVQKKSATELALDDYIKDAMKRHADAQRTADKMLKAKILDKQTQQTLSKIEELNDDEEEYEEEDGGDFSDKLINNLISGFMKGKAQNSDFLKNNPVLSDAVGKLTPEEIEKIKQKYLN